MSETRRYLKLTDEDGYHDYYSGGADHVEFVTDIEDATSISVLSGEELQRLLISIKRDHRENDVVSFVDLTEQPVDLEGEYLEVIQWIAISRLTIQEVRALGLEKRATYLKLRHHLVDDETPQ